MNNKKLQYAALFFFNQLFCGVLLPATITPQEAAFGAAFTNAFGAYNAKPLDYSKNINLKKALLDNSPDSGH